MNIYKFKSMQMRNIFQKSLNHARVKVERGNQQYYKRRILQRSFHIFCEQIKYRTNDNGVIFEIATLELDVLCNIHDIYLNYYCD